MWFAMEVLDPSEAALCNYEVMSFLREEKDRSNNSKDKCKGNIATVMLETLTALEDTPCNQQDKDKVVQFMTRMEQFDLTKSEKLMLLNHRPKNELEVQLMVEESEERLGEDKVTEIIKVIKEVLGGDDDDEDGEEEEQGEEQDDEEGEDEEDKK